MMVASVPLSEADARALPERLAASHLITQPFRGEPAVDRDALTRVDRFRESRRRRVHVLQRRRVRSQVPQRRIKVSRCGIRRAAEMPEKNGPPETRTPDPLIKSQLL